MSSTEGGALEREWAVLQGNVEQHERNALAIKLVAVVVFAGALVFSLAENVTAWLVVILWIQEAMVRTFQARIGERLLQVEDMLRGTVGPAMQLRSQWMAARKGFAGMLVEYATSAARPTVAFPYGPLLLIDLFLLGGAAGVEASPA